MPAQHDTRGAPSVPEEPSPKGLSKGTAPNASKEFVWQGPKGMPGAERPSDLGDDIIVAKDSAFAEVVEASVWTIRPTNEQAGSIIRSRVASQVDQKM